MGITIRNDMTVELIQSVGGDETILAAARVSTQGESSRESLARSPKESAGLINFLMKNRHGSPFEHVSMTFYIEAPIFVFREFHRHRAGWSYNEASGRYRQLEPVFYAPGPERNLVQVGKAGHYSFVPGTQVQLLETQKRLRHAYVEAYAAYEDLTSMGTAKEVARACLPVGTYSSMYATCNARSLMHFLSLRTKHEYSTIPSYPQYEI